MLVKINKLKTWQATLILFVVGFIVYSHGLHNPFEGDDLSQIVNNVPVHSISNIKLFFEGSTFYNGNGLAPLSGIYYRPLMTTIYSIIYTFFGPHQFYFHLFQLLFGIGTAILLYLFLRLSFKPAVSLFLSLLFMIHPLNSQVIYANANLQDVLYVFFGVLALYVLFRFKSIKSLFIVALCLFLSMLSKETGILFVCMALLYLYWFNRKRLAIFAAITAVPVALWSVLRINAVGFAVTEHDFPIDRLSLSGRLMTTPSIVLFYLSKFIFPFKLATGYYWVHPSFSFRYVLVPLIIDLAVIACVIYVAKAIRRKTTIAKYHTFLYFACWSALGFLAIMQIIPLDYTATEAWFYFPGIGILGMIGVAVSVYSKSIKIDARIVMAAAVILLALLGTRTYLRAHDYSSVQLLAIHDIAASPTEYNAYYNLAGIYITQGKYHQAEADILQAINIYPADTTYYDYGLILGHLRDYAGAKKAYDKGLTYGDDNQIYDELSELTLISGSPKTNYTFLNEALSKYPQDSKLLIYLAIFDQQHGNNSGAKAAIADAENYGSVPQGLVTNIQNNLSFPLGIQDLDKTIQIQ